MHGKVIYKNKMEYLKMPYATNTYLSKITLISLQNKLREQLSMQDMAALEILYHNYYKHKKNRSDPTNSQFFVFKFI